MSFIDPKAKRRIVPRWRYSFGSTQTPESSSTREQSRLESADAALLENDGRWVASSALEDAIDLVNAAVVSGAQTEGLSSAIDAVMNSPDTSPELRRVVESHLLGERKKAPGEVSGVQEARLLAPKTRIAHLRSKVRSYPRDALAWLDLALAYVLVGKPDRAERAIRTALHSAPQSRAIVRPAVRFYVHQHEPDIALALVRRVDGVQQDPWLIAAEIAASSIADRSPSLVRAGRDILTSGDEHPRSVSELASALATLEIEHGDNRKARRLLRLSLVDPTENAIAQAEWAGRVENLALGVGEHLGHPESFEARAWNAFSSKDFEDSLRNAAAWLQDEQFSSRPALLVSHLTSLVEHDHSRAAEVLESSLAANQGDAILLNDLAYHLALAGRLDEAFKRFSSIEVSSLEGASAVVAQATAGLLYWRIGDQEVGYRLYEAAIEGSVRLRNRALEAAALFNLAREEARQGLMERAQQRFAKAVDIAVPLAQEYPSLLPEIELNARNSGISL